MKWLSRIFAKFFNKKSGQRDDDKPIVGDKSGPAEKLEIPRSGAGGSRRQNRALTKEEKEQETLMKLRKSDPHANVLSELPWNTIKIYTDGALEDPQGHGKKKRGFGIWFGTAHPLNKSKALSDTNSTTNNTTYLELTGIEDALRELTDPKENYYCCQPVAIFTDSEVAVKYLNGTQNPPDYMQNKVDEIKKIMKVVIGGIQFDHVKSHAYVYGNIQADKFATEARGKVNPEEVWTLPDLTKEYKLHEQPDEFRMVKRLEHAKEIAELDWKTIVVYTAEDQKSKQYAGWFGRDHPLNFVENGESLDDANLLRLRAVEKVLKRLEEWLSGKPVCIVVDDLDFTKWTKHGGVPVAVKEKYHRFPARLEAIQKIMAGLEGDVKFKSIDEKWEVPGRKKAHALIRGPIPVHRSNCPKETS